jgi:DNA sulfur modification protein DndB
MKQEQQMIDQSKGQMALACLRGVIGNWVYYSSMMSAKQIAEWVLPVKDIREAKALDDLLQRSLNDGRKEAISKYLQSDDSRFFNSIIVGVFDAMPDWLEFDISKANLYVNSKSDLKTAKESVGLLIFNGYEKMFAIDGQHRVAGIKIAHNEDSKNVLVDDQFSVIFIAHVDDALGKKRTRKLFSDINKNARPVAGGDKIKIDEQDINAIVARRIFADYQYFDKGSLIDLTENSNLNRGDVTHFTNLLAIYTVNKILSKSLFKIPKSTFPWDEENVVNLKEIVVDFYDYIVDSVPDYKAFFTEKTLNLKVAREKNTYILFRPIGLFLIARLYSYFKTENI